MKISILGDYFDTLQTLSCFRKLEGHEVTTWNDHVQDIDLIGERLTIRYLIRIKGYIQGGKVGYSIAQKQRQFMLGNEAIAWAALEKGVNYVAGYPGTPSSEIVQELAKHSSMFNLHAEWSANEKVAV